MSITVDAVYEDGVLKPAHPLPLKDNERVQIIIAAKANWVQETAGILRCTDEAVYENGVLKPTKVLPLNERDKVQITVQVGPEREAATADEAERIVRRSYGLLGWTGDAETVRRVAQDPGFGLQESL